MDKNDNYQKALDRLYSLKDGIKNTYPYVERKKSMKFQQDEGIKKLINQDRKDMNYDEQNGADIVIQRLQNILF